MSYYFFLYKSLPTSIKECFLTHKRENKDIKVSLGKVLLFINSMSCSTVDVKVYIDSFFLIFLRNQSHSGRKNLILIR